MKRKIVLLGILALAALSITFYACEKESSIEERTDVNTKSNDILVIGENDANGDFQITADTAAVLDNWNYNLLQHGKINAQLKELVTFKEDTIVYLRATGANWTSTTGLKFNSMGQADSGGVICTTHDCQASTTACKPTKDMKDCTSCNSGAGDCVKATTKGSSSITTRYLAQMEITFE